MISKYVIFEGKVQMANLIENYPKLYFKNQIQTSIGNIRKINMY